MEENPKEREAQSKENYRLEETRKERDSLRENNTLLISILVGVVLISIAILFFVLSGDSHYDRGVEFLRQKQYSEALVEFQKVDPGEKDFKMAQSKINYINGLLAFNNGLKQEAKVHLSRVDPADEYYHDAQLMLDKINIVSNESLNEAVRKDRDTVIIKEKVIETPQENAIETPQEKVKEAEPKSSIDAISKRYISDLDILISRFESLYQSAKTAAVNSKKDYIRNMDSIYSEFVKLEYNSKEKSAMILELKNLADNWMQKRIAFINSLIAENSVSGEPNTSRYKAEEEKEYTKMMNQMRKVKSFLLSAD